jgi:hypothetical protein
LRAKNGSLDAARLRLWVAEPGIDQRRRGFFGLAPEIVARRAAESGHDAEATACLAALERALAATGLPPRAAD